MKHHLTETYKQNFEIHNIVLSSQSISLMFYPPSHHVTPHPRNHGVKLQPQTERINPLILVAMRLSLSVPALLTRL